VVLEFVVVSGGLDGGIAAGSGQSEVHGLLKQLEPLHLLNGLERRLWLLKDDKSLTLGL
jgi:hypothetical protein